MTAPTITTPDDLLVAVDELARLLREEGPKAEVERHLTDRAVSALREAGFFRIWVPREYGGMEMDLVPALRIFERLSYVEGAAGWVVGNAAAIHTLCQLVPDEGADEIFATPDPIVAGGWSRPGKAIPVEGGYQVTGQFPFASGADAATYMIGMALAMDGDAPALHPTGDPVMVAPFFPPEDAENLDDWRTLGLRGTGSHDLRVTDLFVPHHRVVTVAPFGNPGRAFQGPLYRMGAWVAPTQICIQPLGQAQAALDAALELVQSKRPPTRRALRRTASARRKRSREPAPTCAPPAPSSIRRRGRCGRRCNGRSSVERPASSPSLPRRSSAKPR